jgi:hypothetical protein
LRLKDILVKHRSVAFSRPNNFGHGPLTQTQLLKEPLLPSLKLNAGIVACEMLITST